MVYELTSSTIMIFAGFIIFIFIIYKLFKILLKGTIVAGAGFSFPWFVHYLNLPLDIAANMQTGIQFAVAALTIFLIYEFFHYIKYLFKVLLWPFKLLRRKK